MLYTYVTEYEFKLCVCCTMVAVNADDSGCDHAHCHVTDYSLSQGITTDNPNRPMGTYELTNSPVVVGEAHEFGSYVCAGCNASEAGSYFDAVTLVMRVNMAKGDVDTYMSSHKGCPVPRMPLWDSGPEYRAAGWPYQELPTVELRGAALRAATGRTFGHLHLTPLFATL